MKKGIIILCVGLILFTGVNFAQVFKKTDRFTGETTISSLDPENAENRLSEEPYLSVAFFYKDTEVSIRQALLDNDNLLVASFFSYTEGRWVFRFLENHIVMFLADGKPVEIVGLPSHSNQITEDGLIETIVFMIDWEEFLKLARAEKVEYKLGSYEFELQKNNLEDLCLFRDEVFK